ALRSGFEQLRQRSSLKSTIAGFRKHAQTGQRAQNAVERWRVRSRGLREFRGSLGPILNEIRDSQFGDRVNRLGHHLRGHHLHQLNIWWNLLLFLAHHCSSLSANRTMEIMMQWR